MKTEKLTAVEWLFYRMIMDKTLSEKADFMHEAKEMEEQEKIDFADKYGTYLLQGGIMSAAAYNETFKSE